MKFLIRLSLVVLVALVGAGSASAQIPPLSPWAVGGPVIVFPASAVNGGGVVTSPQLLLPDGSASVPSVAFTSLPTLGLYKANNFGFAGVGGGVTSAYLSFGGGGAIQQNSAAYFGWTGSADAVNGTVDTQFYRDSAGAVGLRTGTNAQTFRIYNTTDAPLTNYERLNFTWSEAANRFRISSTKGGTGTARPIDFSDGVTSLLTIDPITATVAGRNLTVNNPSSGGLGYSTGAGGTQTQATSKSTGVTLNTYSGQITMNAASLAASTSVMFTLTDSSIGANDTVQVVIKSGATSLAYQVGVEAVAAGSCNIVLRNVSAGALLEAVVLNFTVTKGSAS